MLRFIIYNHLLDEIARRRGLLLERKQHGIRWIRTPLVHRGLDSVRPAADDTDESHEMTTTFKNILARAKRYRAQFMRRYRLTLTS
jgi:hypothetical protein